MATTAGENRGLKNGIAALGFSPVPSFRQVETCGYTRLVRLGGLKQWLTDESLYQLQFTLIRSISESGVEP